jgi:hypothetical protein
MKKLSLLLLTTGVLLSCSKDDSKSQNDLLVGVWKESKEELVSGKDNSVIDTYPADDCDKTGSIELFSNGTYQTKRYSFVNKNCVLEGTYNGVYSYNDTSKKLTMDGEQKDVLSLKLNEFVYIVEYTNDQNGDNVNDYYLNYLVK